MLKFQSLDLRMSRNIWTHTHKKKRERESEGTKALISYTDIGVFTLTIKIAINMFHKIVGNGK